MHLLLPGTVLPVTTGAVKEAASIEPAADQTHDPILRLHGQHLPGQHMLTRHTQTRSLLSGLPGRKLSKTKHHGRRVRLVSRLFLTSRKSSIVQQLVQAWQLCRSSLMSPLGRVLHHLQVLLLHILSLEEPMMITRQETLHAGEEELVQETSQQPSTWRKCRSIFTLVTRRL